ncbi:type IV pilus twitching motility protein PilT, partial [Patescibacteria group bacterium]|nr:type IV pilus twitching motility protein PilT [Patescibacteria group bacterium]
INHINENQKCNIITLEDPIEYIFKPKQSLVIQRQLESDMVSFSEGLKHALRQDPNVIMVGEMRDLETIATAITLAETGHLVFATLHTYSASQTIDRIIDIFPPHQQTQIRMQLSITLAAVISQRLVPKIDGGRIAVREILLNTPAISNLIRENKVAQIKTVIETSAREGMISLDRNFEKLYKNKIIAKEVAQAQMENPEILEKFRIL